MQKILKDFCLSGKNNGLLLLDMPTGTGKTHNVLQFIYENYNRIEGKIFFITNLKKNLPIDDLKNKFFIKNNRLEDFTNNVLFLDNNVDSLIENFESVQKEIPEKFNRNEIVINIQKNISIINTLKESLNKKQKDKNNDISIDSAYYIIQQSRDNLAKKWEKELRDLLENELNFDENQNKRTKKEKLDLIKYDINYQWIGKIYPAVYTDERKIIFMSTDKFLVRNSTIIEPSYMMYDNNTILKNSIIFIDEIDASKETILKNIINDCLNAKINIVELFRIIYSGLFDTDFSKLLTTISEDVQRKLDDPKFKAYSPNEIIDEFKKQAKDINEKYKLIFFIS